MKQALCVVAIGLLLSIFSVTAFALQKENAARPGEVLDAETEATTPVLMRGCFAYEISSTGLGTIKIYRSEDNSTNWLLTKTLVVADTGGLRGYLYESMGDDRPGDNTPGAWYKAVLTTLTSGSFRVRLAR